MFDEFVEHAISPAPGPAPLSRAALSQDFQTFESNPYAEEETAMLAVQTDGLLLSQPPQSLFSIGRVQFEIPAPLISMSVASDLLVLGLASNTVVALLFIELSRPEQVIRVPIPRKPQEATLHKVFLDPSGRHVLVTSLQGENWYFYRGWKKVKPLKSFKMIIESVAWNKAALLSTNTTSTGEFLIGTRNGMIYEAVLDAEDDFFKGQERYLQPVFTLPERHPVTGMRFIHFPPAEPRKVLVVVTTPYRIYQFAGNPMREEHGRPFTNLFTRYKDTPPKIDELAGEIDRSELCFYTPHASQAQSLPTSVAWMTSSGVYHGTMNYNSAADGYIDNVSLIPYPFSSSSMNGATAYNDPPIAIAATEFHFVILYKDQVVAVSNLDEKLSYKEMLPLRSGETAHGLAVDVVRGTYWIYTDVSLFELSVGNEDQDVWKIYLAKKMHDVALRYAKFASQKNQILVSQAEAYFDEGKYFPSAQCFAQSSAGFEDVILKFTDAGERDALRSYLVTRLERTRKTEITQRMMLATWLVEFYLSKCNELDDVVASESVSHDVENFQAERHIVEEDLKQFLETYKDNLDRRTVYELIQSHGRVDFYLHYATVVGDLERVVEHWVEEEEWVKAIDMLNRQASLDLYYRFGPVLLSRAPKETVDCWLRQPNLDPLQLVPSLLRLQHNHGTGLSSEHAIQFLKHAIFEQQHTSPTLHNLLITFYANPTPAPCTAGSLAHGDDDAPLLSFLTTAPADPISGKPYYDLDYALRACKQAGRTQACVLIYSKMGLWENSVDLALSKGDVDLAKINADMPEDDQPLRRKLWLKIAKYVVQDKQDIKSAMRFLESTDLLKIEDILPFFPDFVIIDDFKEEICAALEGYSAHIDDLKHEMDEATRSAEAIKQDIAALKNRFVTIEAGERCSVCSLVLLTRQFYVFPCNHMFHVDCLIGLVKEYLPAHALRRIVGLQTALIKDAQGPLDRQAILSPSPTSNTLLAPATRAAPIKQRTLLSSNFANLSNGTRAAEALGKNLLSAGDKLRDLIVPDVLSAVISSPNWSAIPGVGFGGAKNTLENENGGRGRREKLREELDELLASSCPLCESVVAGIDKPFVKEVGSSSWDL